MAIEVFQSDMIAAAGSLPTRPVVFDGLFGWFSPGITRRGVILCGTHGFEQLSAHRSWRALGERIAATGCATLRFDYPGEGDSGDAGAGRAEAWLGSIRCAIRFLREAAGSEEIVLVGLRLGGTLAVLAAREEGVDRLALLAPFASGRTYLREMKLQSRTIGRLPDGSPLPQEAGTLMIGGFRIGPELAADLSAIDLAAVGRPPAPKILLLGTDAGGLAARLTGLGCAVAARPFQGLDRLVANPLFAEAPDEAFSDVVDFVAEGAHAGLAPLGTRPPRNRITGSVIDGAAWHEEPVLFGADLFGILCRPDDVVARHPTVLFVNAGTNVRSGWGRQTTALARRLAGDGVSSLRMDLRGIGDSPDRPGGTSPLFKLDALDDLRAALDHLEELDAGPIILVGACSGAFLGFHAICREHRVKAALLINPYCFDWNPDDDVETVIRNVIRNPSTYLGLLRQGSAWRRLMRGEIHVGAIALALTKVARDGLRRHLARLLRRAPPGGTVARRIADLRRRGARLRLVYSAGDRGLANLHAHLGGTPAQHLGEPAFIIDGADHDLSTAESRDRLHGLLSDLLGKI